ncbi:hypothetical protein WR25_14001 [Diploscapter pachys]|uniref:Innexin n=1 Tax=Diploscapter pachys TaxID=2018661 RepID=A0A2A2KV94_9BILA|nr:hypothetical protein WR25_14001 [Diploscapter pachys]
MVFSEIVGTLSFLQPQPDDDISDRLHYYYTTTFLLLTAVLISLKMFGGRPIECWLPAEYRSSWEDYTEMYCWAKNTYYAPLEGDLPEVSHRDRTMVSYYQWVPFFLVIVAFMFYSPCLLWRLLYDKSGIRLKDIMGFANDKSNVQPGLSGVEKLLNSIQSGAPTALVRRPADWEKDELVEARARSADQTSEIAGLGFGRKTSVLVPLVSREDLTQTTPIPTDQFLRPPSRM